MTNLQKKAICELVKTKKRKFSAKQLALLIPSASTRRRMRSLAILVDSPDGRYTFNRKQAKRLLMARNLSEWAKQMEMDWAEAYEEEKPSNVVAIRSAKKLDDIKTYGDLYKMLEVIGHLRAGMVGRASGNSHGTSWTRLLALEKEGFLRREKRESTTVFLRNQNAEIPEKYPASKAFSSFDQRTKSPKPQHDGYAKQPKIQGGIMDALEKLVSLAERLETALEAIERTMGITHQK